MKDLPALYAAVCAKRPELAVPMLTIDVNPPGWSLCGSWCGEHFAAALILARWVEALPVGKGVYHAETYDSGEPRWWVFGNASMPTPLEALAAYYLEQ